MDKYVHVNSLMCERETSFAECEFSGWYQLPSLSYSSRQVKFPPNGEVPVIGRLCESCDSNVKIKWPDAMWRIKENDYDSRPLPQSMDLVLRICDDYFLDKIWASLIPLSVPREYVPRQLISLCVITLIGIHVLYFLFAWISYKFIFNHEMMKHPRFLKDQVKLEIQSSLRSFPGMMLLTLPWFQAEVMGYSKMYDGLDTYGYFYLVASVPLYVYLWHFYIA